MVPLSGEEKGALLLKNLAPQVAEKILTLLGSERGTRLRALMERVQPGPQTQKILADLMAEIRQAAAAAIPGKSVNIVSGSEGQSSPLRIAPGTAAQAPSDTQAAAKPTTDKASSHSKPRLSPLPSIPEGQDPLITLGQIPPDRIALALETETPRTASIILNFLEGDVPGEVFSRLPKEQRAEVSVQFSTQSMPHIEILRRMAQAVVQKCQKMQEKPSYPEGSARIRKMADMLRLLDRTQRQQVVKELEEKAPEVAGQLKGMMYRFDDVLRLDNRSTQKILREIDTRNLAIALRGAEDTLKQKFIVNLSKRAQENLAEEIELARSVPREEVEQAQDGITQIILRMDLAGELVMTE